MTNHERSDEDAQQVWAQVRQTVLKRDRNRCQHCGDICGAGEADIHHLIPRKLGGRDEATNLVTLCDGCHAALHPNSQVALSRRFIERWAIRLATWLDRSGSLSDGTPNLGDALRLLGATEFRGRQLDVVLAALRGESVLFVSPTGSGKSLCFQVPSLLRSNTAVVVVPLKALMNDQVSSLQKQAIPCSFINSDIGPDEKAKRLELLDEHALKFIYVTPERFDPAIVKEDDIYSLSRVSASFFVIDEAHCIDRWGSDFRPSYGRLGDARKLLGNPPVLAFTATAGTKLQNRITESLGIQSARVIVAGVDRPNIALLRLYDFSDPERIDAIVWVLKNIPAGRVMIFVPTTKIGNSVAEHLLSAGLDVPFFHSKLGTATDREMLLKRFTGLLSPPIQFIICTNAFGMGLDVPDVRAVIHWQHPSSVEDYLQEFGRAGRDGAQSLAVLFVTKDRDKSLPEFMARLTVESAKISKEEKFDVLMNRLDKIVEIHELATNSRRCFRGEIVRYFEGEKLTLSKPLSVRILEWLLLRKAKNPKVTFCCDFCDSVTKENFRDWVGVALPRR